jgi:lambda repressor-like predicted transcriptional regulator
MSSWTEETMAEALIAIENGLSQRAAAKRYGIPASTLRGRLTGAVPSKQAAIARQLLSDTQEAYLAHWATVQEALGTPQVPGSSVEPLKSFSEPGGSIRS